MRVIAVEIPALIAHAVDLLARNRILVERVLHRGAREPIELAGVITADRDAAQRFDLCQAGSSGNALQSPARREDTDCSVDGFADHVGLVWKPREDIEPPP